MVPKKNMDVATKEVISISIMTLRKAANCNCIYFVCFLTLQRYVQKLKGVKEKDGKPEDFKFVYVKSC